MYKIMEDYFRGFTSFYKVYSEVQNPVIHVIWSFFEKMVNG